MGANPTRVDWEAPVDSGSPLQQGNRVLETIARQEALRALLAFSDLHEQIRNRPSTSESACNRDLFETERFILDEVLQLLCDRAQAITQADAVMIALREKLQGEEGEARSGERLEGKGKGSTRELSELVCRAAAGPLSIARGVRLIGESEFLRDSLETGQVLRCDDGETDPRVELDFAHHLGARSTVLVPLRGEIEQLGVLQAFSTTAGAFTNQDIRCFGLFAELVLSVLKPQDQDRRIHWLSDVAGAILNPRQSGAALVVADAPAIDFSEIQSDEMAAETAPPLRPMPALDQPFRPDRPGLKLATNERTENETVGAIETTPVRSRPLSSSVSLSLLSLRRVSLSFLRRISLPESSLPGLSVVLGLVVIAALFSAGAWWGMQAHEKTPGTKFVATKGTNAAGSPPSVTAPPSPPADTLFPAISDNLMNAAKPGLDAAPPTAVAPDRLAALPKITGVRHWASSMGSTVVIDMEDQVPYEVHRLTSPERIYFDLHDTVLPSALDGKTMDVGDASLTRVRVAQPVAGMTRIVLDTKDGSNFSVSMESNPYRLVVELRSEKTLAADGAAPNRIAPSPHSGNQNSASVNPAAAAAASLPSAAEQPAFDQSLAKTLPAKTGKFRIVLDAGHGGWDLGTVGRKGLLEKDLVLDVTQRLGKLLQTRLGSEVLFTRTDDTYLPLDQRADMANQAQADLFVSIHANYSSSAPVRGIETYYTNLFSAPGSREVEKHDDGTFTKMTPVSLSAGGLHEKIEESRRLAASVQRSLYATLAAKNPDIRDRGIKDSAFVVLTGATMPAILTEISFMSSPADERNLQSASYRQEIAEALYKGIAHYEAAAPRAKVAQLQTDSAHR